MHAPVLTDLLNWRDRLHPVVRRPNQISSWIQSAEVRPQVFQLRRHSSVRLPLRRPSSLRRWHQRLHDGNQRQFRYGTQYPRTVNLKSAVPSCRIHQLQRNDQRKWKRRRPGHPLWQKRPAGGKQRVGQWNVERGQRQLVVAEKDERPSRLPLHFARSLSWWSKISLCKRWMTSLDAHRFRSEIASRPSCQILIVCVWASGLWPGTRTEFTSTAGLFIFKDSADTKITL